MIEIGPRLQRVALATGGATVALIASLRGVDGVIVAIATAMVFYAIGREIGRLRLETGSS